MTRWVRGRRRWPPSPRRLPPPAAPAVLAAVAVAAALMMVTGPPPRPAAAQAGGSASARQVTLFAVVATPGSRALDPKLKRIEPQLRKLLPDHGFKLIEVRSKRLDAGESVRCDLGRGLVASSALVQPLDENGKVVLRCALSQNGAALLDTMVATPPNQLFFCDRPLDDGTRLLIGIGAR